MDAWYWVAAERLEQLDAEVPRAAAREVVAIAPVLRYRPVGPVHAIDRETGRALCNYKGSLHPVPKAWGEIRWDDAEFTPCEVCREQYSSADTDED